MQVYTHYEHYKGGTNNLQVSRVIIGISTVRIFKSLKNKAHQKAEKFIIANANHKTPNNEIQS